MKALKVVAFAMLFGSMSLFGANYGNMSTDDLLNLRGTLSTQQERQELHKELQHRYQSMTQEQKEKFDTKPGKGMMGQMQGSGQGKGMMGGQGMGMGKGKQ